MRFAALAVLVLTACPPGTTVPPTVVDTGICVLATVSTDLLSGMPFPQAVEDAAVKCFGSASAANIASVQAIYSAHLAAETNEAAARDAGGQ